MTNKPISYRQFRAQIEHPKDNFFVENIKCSTRISAYFDGSCLVNPHGQIGYGYHINYDGIEISSGYGGERAKTGNSNNVAEYRGLILILQELLTLKNESITIFGDSRFIINQMERGAKIGNGFYRPDGLIAKELEKKVKAKNNIIKYKWIPRELNERADELSNVYHNR